MAELSPDAFGFSAAAGPKELDPSAFGFGPGRAVAQPEKPAGGLVAAAKQAIGSTIKGAGQAASDFIPGVTTANPVTTYGQGIIDANPTAVQSLGDIVESPWMATKEAIGNAAGSMAGMVGSAIGAKALGGGLSAVAPFTGPAAPIVGGAGKLVSTFGPGVAPIVTAALPSYGGIREEQIKADPANEADARSKAIAALGAGTVGAIETKFGPQDWALSAMKKGGIEAVAKNFADAKSIPGAIGKGILHGGAVEGAEELVQNPIEQLASYQDPTSRQAVGETLFGGAMGALGGGALGGGMAGVAKAMTPEQPVVTLPGASPTVAQTSTAPTTAVQPNVAPQPATVSAPIEINPAAGPLQAATVAGIQSGAVQPAVTTNQVANEANQVDAGSAVTVAQATGQGEAPVQEASVPAASGLSGYARAPEVGAATFDRSTTPKNGGYGATENYAQPVVAEPANTGAPRVTPIGLAGSASAGQAATNTPAAPEIPPVSTAAPTTQTKQAETAGVPISTASGTEPVNSLKSQEPQGTVSKVVQSTALPDAPTNTGDTRDADPMYGPAVKAVQMIGSARSADVADALKIDYNRAARLIEQMERDGIVSPMDASGARTIASTVASTTTTSKQDQQDANQTQEAVTPAPGREAQPAAVSGSGVAPANRPIDLSTRTDKQLAALFWHKNDRVRDLAAAEIARRAGMSPKSVSGTSGMPTGTSGMPTGTSDIENDAAALAAQAARLRESASRAIGSQRAKLTALADRMDAARSAIVAQSNAPAPKKPQVGSRQSPIMRRNDLVGAIMRVTGGNGIASVMAQDIAGDKAGAALSKLRGLFTNRGVSDLGDVAMLLREEEGFDVRDGNHLAELIRRASSGDVAVSMERAARDADADQEKRHRDRIRSQAKKYGVKTQFVKFSDLEARVLKVMEQRHDKAVAALDDRAKKRFDAELERSYSLVSEDEVDAVLVDVNGRGFRGRSFWNEATKLLRGMNDDAVARKMEDAIDAAVEGPEPDWLKDDDGRGNQPTGGGDEADRGDQAEAPGFGLAGQSAEDVARQEADRVAAEKSRKAADDKAAAEKKAADDRAAIKQRSEAAADTFVLGGDAMQNLTGQVDMFAAPPAAAKQIDPLQSIGFKALSTGNDWAKKVPTKEGAAHFNVRQYGEPSKFRLSVSHTFANGITGSPTREIGVFDSIEAVADAARVQVNDAERSNGVVFEQPSAEPSAQPGIRATSGGQQEAVPPAVLSRIKIALNRLREVERELAGVERARGRGHILALELRDKRVVIDAALAKIADFRVIASGRGIDADAVINELGGEPDFDRFGKPAAPEQRSTINQAFEDGQKKANAADEKSDASNTEEPPAWHTALPTEGLPITEVQKKSGGYNFVIPAIAADAYSAVTQNQKMGGGAMYAYYMPESNGLNGIVRLLPDDQKPPKPWTLLSGEALRPHIQAKEQIERKLSDWLRSAPVIGNEKVVAKAAKPVAKQAAPDWREFEYTRMSNGDFELRDGNMTAKVEAMGEGKYQASFRGAKSSPHATLQSAIDWAANYRKDAQKSPTAEPANTEDSGSELTYNRRNRLTRGLKWEDIADKDEALRVKEVTKAKVYPKPDYQALIDGGVTPTDAYMVKLVYDSIAIKPNTRAAPSDADLQEYIAGVGRVMSDAIEWADDNALSRPSLLKSVYPNGWREGEAELRVVGGNKVLAALQPGYTETRRASKDIAAGWPEKQETWQRQGVKVINGNDVKAETLEGGGAVTVWFRVKEGNASRTIRSVRIDGAENANSPDVRSAIENGLAEFSGHFVLLDKFHRAVGTHATEDEAKEAARALASKSASKQTVSDKGISVLAASRTGIDRRMPGEDISSDRFRETFKFKGVNFGNWMKGDANAKERQLHLNHAYESFMDLADVLGVPPEAMSLNGMLGVAIGAQGNGGRASAHFVPGVNEINLTRESGAGSLAHEWGHALDHYFARQAGMARATDPFLTERLGSAAGAGIRPEIVAKFDAIVQAMRKRSATPQEREAKAKKGIADAEVQIGRWLREPLLDRKLTDDAEVAQAVEKIKAGDLGDGTIAVSSRSVVRPAVHDLAMLVKKKSGKKLSVDTMIGVNAHAERIKYLRDTLSGDASHVPQQMVQTKYLDDAVKLDAEKGGKKYWSTNLEMFARAFDAFVSDALESRAAKNTYLSHAGRSGETVPTGAERTAINEAIKGLVDAVETKAGEDGNVVLFSFAGQQSATADKFQLDRAQQLLADGADAEAVRQQTGWFKGADEKWRYEIDDSGASLKAHGFGFGELLDAIGKNPKLADVLDHPALFAAYPSIAGASVEAFDEKSQNNGELVANKGGGFTIRVNAGLGEAKALSVLLHEIQHGIQNVEGFASGGSPDTMASFDNPQIRTLEDKISALMASSKPGKQVAKEVAEINAKIADLRRENPYSAYRRLAGEVEARNVQARRNFSADRRKYANPDETADTARADVIVVFNGKAASSAPAPANARPSTAGVTGVSPADSAIYSMAQEGKSASEILSFIGKASRRPFNRYLANALRNLGAASTITLDSQGGFAFGNRSYAQKYAAAYNPKTDTVTLFTPRSAETHVLHEFVHAATLKAIANGGPASMRMRALFRHVQKSGALDGQYGMSNLDEFVAEAFSNPKFQQALKAVPAPNGSTLKSAWQWFVQAVARILGLRTPAMETALDRAMTEGAALMRENAELADDGGAARFSPTQIKIATGNTGTFSPDNLNIRYNVADSWPTSALPQAAAIRNTVANAMRSDANTSWLTPFNTQYHKAEKWAAEGKVRFKRVFDLVQRFLGDVSKFAVMAQNEAPTLFHEWRTLADVKRTLTSGDVLGNQHRADVAAIASPLYEGTLYGGGNPLSGIRWSDDQLRDRFNLTARQIKPYHEALAAVKVSMDEMAKSIVAQHAKRVGVDFDEGMSLEDMVADVSNRMEELQDEIRFQFLSEEAEESVAASVEHYLEMDMEEEAQKTRANFEKQKKAAQAQIEQIDKTMEDIKAVESKNVALQKAGYFPLMRFGKHTVTAKDADGKVQFFGMYEGIPLVPRSGQYEANKVAAELRAEFPEWTVTTGIKNDEKYKLYQGLNIEAIQLFADHMDKEDLEPFQEFIRLATNNRSAQRRLLHRQGTPGFDRDVRRTLAQFVVSNARATSSNYHTQDMLRAAADAEKDGGDIGAEAVKLVEYVRNPAEEAQALRGFLFFNFLGGSLASAAVNLTQTPMMTLPFLSKFESAQRVTRRLMAAAKMAARNPESLPAGKLRDALLRAEMDGVTAPQEIHQLTATAANNIFAGSRLANGLLRGWGAPFAMAESFNRRIAFIAAFQIAESMSPAELAKTGFKDAFEFAEDAVKQTQGIYNKGNRMNVGRGSVGSVLMTFKQYSIMYLELLKRLPPKQRAIMVGVLLLAAGGGGLPGVEDVEDLIDTIGQWLGFATNSRRALRNTLTEWVGRDGSDIVLNGLLSRMGIDLHSRMGMQNLIPGSGILKQSSVDKGRDIEEFFGPAASVVKSLGDALESLATGHPGRAGMALAPGAVRNVVQGAKMAATGYAEDAKGRRTVPVNELESAAKMVGFNPKSVADYGTVKRDIAQDQRLVGVKREEFTSAIADAILSGDTEARKQAMSDMAQWNRDNPTLRFTIAPGAIVRRVKEARTEGATRFLKAVPKGMRSQAIEEMRQ